jgi:DNA-binding CsgD family transcriptional regulator
MTPRRARPGEDGARRAALLTGAVAAQALCAVFFVGDVLADWRAGEPARHLLLEAAVAAALALGVVFGALEVRRALDRARRAETAVSAASGAFAEVMRARFEDWRLTAAEADVALFALKGLDAAEIAAVRGASAGTVRAQLARVYAKAGVANRGQFASLFLDALLDGPLADPPAGDG